MQQQVQKVLAKKKQEKHQFIADSHVNNVADKPVDNIEKCNLNYLLESCTFIRSLSHTHAIQSNQLNFLHLHLNYYY